MANTDYDILTYNFHTIDVEKVNLNEIANDNPLKLVFKMAKELLEIKHNPQDIFNAKLKLADELSNCKNVRNDEQIKALVYFLEYLFLIDDKKLEEKFKYIEKEKGGRFLMTVDQIREIYLTEKGKDQGIKEGIKKGIKKGEKNKSIEIAQNLLDVLDNKTIAEKTGLTEEEVAELRNN